MSNKSFLSPGDEDFVFQEAASQGVYLRKLAGFELSFMRGSERSLKSGSNGVGTLHVTIAKPHMFADVQKWAREAWVRLRYSVPLMACTTHRSLFANDDYFLRYAVPRSQADVGTWLQSTVSFSENPETQSNLQHRRSATLASYVDPPRYLVDLFICPAANAEGWLISVKYAHHAFDGRGSTYVTARFLDHFSDVVEGRTYTEPQWGREVERLPPAAAAIVAGGKVLKDMRRVEKPYQDYRFLREQMAWIPERNAEGSIAATIYVCSPATAQLKQVAKLSCSATVTTVITALAILAQVEACLTLARRKGDLAEVAKQYSKSQYYVLAANAADRRMSMAFGGDTALLAMESSSALFSMETIRRIVSIDTENSTVISPAAVIERQVTSGSAARIAYYRQMADTPSLFLFTSLGNSHELVFRKHMVPRGQAVVLKDSVGHGNNCAGSFLGMADEVRGQLRIHFNSGGGVDGADYMRLFVSTMTAYLDWFVETKGASTIEFFDEIMPNREAKL
ncbi:hypothetical protein FISHEDRAFT_60585 [Fistulina hepatica ATCC 64428]|uniref:Uncharacterized protein n=1 Tax=Fistulina hepatica ATCC 64428 TaxID=1128425 RepID=A0A0D7A501_9AGAR|nr:hypothetical protein FISHEDRAFT_60585 [Fistulina hepatica ATCC 64428]